MNEPLTKYITNDAFLINEEEKKGLLTSIIHFQKGNTQYAIDTFNKSIDQTTREKGCIMLNEILDEILKNAFYFNNNDDGKKMIIDDVTPVIINILKSLNNNIKENDIKEIKNMIEIGCYDYNKQRGGGASLKIVYILMIFIFLYGKINASASSELNLPSSHMNAIDTLPKPQTGTVTGQTATIATIGAAAVSIACPTIGALAELASGTGDATTEICTNVAYSGAVASGVLAIEEKLFGFAAVNEGNKDNAVIIGDIVAKIRNLSESAGNLSKDQLVLDPYIMRVNTMKFSDEAGKIIIDDVKLKSIKDGFYLMRLTEELNVLKYGTQQAAQIYEQWAKTRIEPIKDSYEYSNLVNPVNELHTKFKEIVDDRIRNLNGQEEFKVSITKTMNDLSTLIKSGGGFLGTSIKITDSQMEVLENIKFLMGEGGKEKSFLAQFFNNNQDLFTELKGPIKDFVNKVQQSNAAVSPSIFITLYLQLSAMYVALSSLNIYLSVGMGAAATAAVATRRTWIGWCVSFFTSGKKKQTNKKDEESEEDQQLHGGKKIKRKRKTKSKKKQKRKTKKNQKRSNKRRLK